MHIKPEVYATTAVAILATAYAALEDTDYVGLLVAVAVGVMILLTIDGTDIDE